MLLVFPKFINIKKEKSRKKKMQKRGEKNEKVLFAIFCPTFCKSDEFLLDCSIGVSLEDLQREIRLLPVAYLTRQLKNMFY